MLDPLSVTGLTLGVFDELLRLGERTAELITDIKGFHEVSPLKGCTLRMRPIMTAYRTVRH